MKRSFHYILVPLFYFLVALAGSWFTSIDTWYINLGKPSFTPPGSVIGPVWTVIYILTAMSLIVYINKAKNTKRFWSVIFLYIANGIVNAAWSYFFFTIHRLGLAVLDAGLIWVTLLFIIVFAWRDAKIASILLFPYLGWVSFATFLTYAIYSTN